VSLSARTIRSGSRFHGPFRTRTAEISHAVILQPPATILDAEAETPLIRTITGCRCVDVARRALCRWVSFRIAARGRDDLRARGTVADRNRHDRKSAAVCAGPDVSLELVGGHIAVHVGEPAFNCSSVASPWKLVIGDNRCRRTNTSAHVLIEMISRTIFTSTGFSPLAADTDLKR